MELVLRAENCKPSARFYDCCDAGSASEDQIQQVIDHLVKLGFEVHRSTGARQTVLGAVGARLDFDIRTFEVAARCAGGAPHQFALQAGGRSFRPEGTIVNLPNGVEHWRQGSCRDGRAVLGGVARADCLLTAEAIAEGGSRGPARRRIQAALVSLFLSGAWAKMA